MTDHDRPLAGANDEDRLPWLEAVEDEQDERGVTAGKLIAAVIAALVALGLVIGGVFWIRQRHATPDGQGDLIAAPAGDYKRAPTPAEANSSVEGEGDATYAASQGANVSSTIDTTRIPEAPVTGGVTASDATGSKALPPPTAPVAAPKPAPVKTATPTPAKPEAEPEKKAPAKSAEAEKPKTTAKPQPAPEKEAAASGAGVSKQIGAYSSQAKADAASSDLTHRFPALRGLSLSVRSGESKGKTVYRIFMKGPETKVEAVCRALHSAKEGCIPG